MASIPLKNLAGEDKGSVEVSDAVFAARVNQPLVHQSVVQLLANPRLGTHDVKGRGEVSRAAEQSRGDRRELAAPAREVALRLCGEGAGSFLARILGRIAKTCPRR